MKLGYNRETIIGLSVLSVLTIVLGVVAVRRLTRHDVRPELSEVRAEVKAQESSHEEYRLREIEMHKPVLAAGESPLASDAAQTPVAAQAHRDPAQWEVHAKERHEDKVDHPREVSLLSAALPTAPDADKHERHEEAEHNHKSQELVAALPADDRYAAPVVNRYAVATAPPPERIDSGAAQPMVVQISGDAPDTPRRLDGPAPERQHALRQDHLANDPRRDEAASPLRYSALERNEVSPPDNRQDRVADARNNFAAPPPAYGSRDPRSAHDPVAAAPPIDRGPANYPGPGAAFGREDSMRSPEIQPPAAQHPLRNDGMYEVQPNDSYWTISSHVYGSGAYFRALAELNRGKAARPDRLSPGLLISTPPVAQLEKDYPDFCPRPNRRETVGNRGMSSASTASYAGGGRTYVVQEGDSLTSIARNELGKVSRWADIYQLNRDALGKDYDYLTPGLRLTLPSHDTPDRTAHRPDEAPPYTR